MQLDSCTPLAQSLARTSLPEKRNCPLCGYLFERYATSLPGGSIHAGSRSTMTASLI